MKAPWKARLPGYSFFSGKHGEAYHSWTRRNCGSSINLLFYMEGKITGYNTRSNISYCKVTMDKETDRA